MIRVEIDVSKTFVPAERDPSNNDRRPLGVQLRILAPTASRSDASKPMSRE